MHTEANLIARLARIIPSATAGHGAKGIALGIGDDAAVLRWARARDCVVSTDGFIEGRHFLARIHSPDAVGFKALARAASDLAAMGATPRYFLLTLSLPRGKAGTWLEQFARGMAVAARRLQMRLIGGDISSHERVVAALTVMGEVRRGKMLTRRGGRPGDAIYASGRLGAAQAGLEMMLRSGRADGSTLRRSYALARHMYPVPRVELGGWLAGRGLATAAMDLSDGLSTDLARLCAASGVGAVVHAAALPVARDDRPGTRRRNAANAEGAELRRALHGGEDYELLFCVRPRLASRIPSGFRGVPITRIGELTAGGTVMLEENGRTRPLRPGGWEHFARR